jgi:hypothetical protein
LLVTINGFSYRSTIAVYGGKYYLPLKRANAATAGVRRWRTGHQREHVEAIEEAKRPETRERRVDKTIEMIESGRLMCRSG